MILANHPCPDCKTILECEGVSEGELVDCPQCGKPFEVPYKKVTAKKKEITILQKTDLATPPKVPPKPWRDYSVSSFRGAFVVVGNIMFAIVLWALIYQFIFSVLNFMFQQRLAFWRIFT